MGIKLHRSWCEPWHLDVAAGGDAGTSSLLVRLGSRSRGALLVRHRQLVHKHTRECNNLPG
jgi:hypothetical protein